MKKTNWFKNAIIYQIYPRSFQDSNGDGMGDIRGIINRLDYLKDLGINCVWLSPVYSSPQEDNGYDISDYKDIYPPFGTLKDFKEMVDEMHKRGIRLIMDLVVNHTSSEHRWFKEARKSVDNPYHDYYIWKKGKKNGKLPTNWMGFFGENTWEYVPECDEYYLHLFAKGQPDLNWENPKVQEEVKSILKFWLDMGVDGFRCDVINLISKDPNIRDGHEFLLKGSKQFVNGPRLHEFLHMLNKEVLSKYDCMTVGETVFTTLEDAKLLTSPEREELDMIFNFDHTNTDNYLGIKWLMRKFKLVNLKKAFDKWQLGNTTGWNSLFIENHDQRRSVGRFNTSETTYRKESAKMLATMYFFQKGTPFIYEGQEIGMTNAHFTSLSQYQDTETHSIYKTLKKMHLPKSYIAKTIPNGSRDNARTPMQWDNTEFAGFSNVKPWLEINKNKDSINVKESIEDKNSILNYYKKMIEIYKDEKDLVDASYKDLLPKHKYLYVYERETNDTIYLCINNFSTRFIKYHIDENYNAKKTLLLGNYSLIEEQKQASTIVLQPFETRLYKIKK